MHVHALLFAATILGIITGLRAFTPITALAWAACCGYLPLEGTRLAFLGSHWCVGILTLLALFEIVNDKLPKTPSRKVPAQFIPRILFGIFCGGIVGVHFDSVIVGLLCGAIGAVIGTLGGSAARGALAKMFGKDLTAAIVEDLIAIFCAFMIVTHHL